MATTLTLKSQRSYARDRKKKTSGISRCQEDLTLEGEEAEEEEEDQEEEGSGATITIINGNKIKSSIHMALEDFRQ